uniref:Uncharacterized protein n=1 Tax=Panagrolaimus davidi TaxID=227884 RepID=A0A914PXF3_9BILA
MKHQSLLPTRSKRRNNSDDDIIKEALEFLIHVIAPNNSHINDVFKEPNLMPLVIKAFDIKKLQIQITATEVILVTSVRGTIEQIEYLIENGIAAAICKHMKVLRFERFEGSEENVLNALLHIVKKGKAKLKIMFNEMEKCGGIDILEELKKSNDFNIRFMAGNIVNAILSAVTKNHKEL